jgi:putative ABC transport system permease protein
MLRNYLKIAIRSLWRNKLHTAINVLGLSIGLSACLTIFLIANYEFGFDHFRSDAERIYRICTYYDGVFTSKNSGTPTGLADLAAEEKQLFSKAADFFVLSGDVQVEQKVDWKNEQDFAIVSPAYFELFPDYEWLDGNPGHALNKPNSIVLTAKQAQRYFNVDNALQAVGKQLIFKKTIPLTVSGIIKDLPPKTDFHFEAFISYATIEHTELADDFELHDWTSTSSSHQLFVALAEGVSLAHAEATFNSMARAAYDEHNTWGKDNLEVQFPFQALKDLHFSSIGIFNYSRAAAHRPTLYALLGIAGLLLFLAIINFVNLETAQSMRRAKEIGVRKTIGGSRPELMSQFLFEAFLLTGLSIVIAVVFTHWALLYFDAFIPEGVSFSLATPAHVLFLFGLLFTVAILAGAYPAFYLSGFEPGRVLKNKTSPKVKGLGYVNLRRALIVFQFFIAQALIFGNLAISSQLGFMLDKELGFNEDAVVFCYLPWGSSMEKRQLLAERMQAYQEVQSWSLHQQTPSSQSVSTTITTFKKEQGEELEYSPYRKFGDTAFIHLYEMELLAGRNLLPSDTLNELLINRAYLEWLGFEHPHEVLGQVLFYGDTPLPVVGVVENFHMSSLHNKIEPAIIGSDEDDYHTLSLKLSAGSELSAFIKAWETEWRQIFPEEEFEHHFLDEAIANFYEMERRASVLISFATGVAILISCLGLLGLISFTTMQRTKEIGIRKVLGASVQQLVALLTKDFVVLILLAALFALPVAWYLTRKWLADFAYHIDLNWWMFVMAVGIALLISMVTVSFQAIKAALSNPVNSLKYE